MINKKMRLPLAISIASLIVLLGISISTVFIALLLGLLFIPPLFVAASVFITGVPIIVEELLSLLESGKEFFVISISKEYVTLEPKFG